MAQRRTGSFARTLWAVCALWAFTLCPRGWAQQGGLYSVRDYGAVGDAVTDDTAAFQRALDAANEVGGVVIVDPVPPGRGYVLTSTVRVPPTTTLMGAPAGMPFLAWEGTKREVQRGPVILARPRAEDYSGATKQPLFLLSGACTVRGLYILYDEQPWPSDEDLADPQSPYTYASATEFTQRFVADHARPYGPTFYLGAGVANVTIEDIICGRYYDFYVQRHGGKVVVNRCYLYGYKRAFAIAEAKDVVRISSIHLVPNVEESISWQHSRLHGAITACTDNVAFELGSVDGYSIRDVCGFLVNTGIRLGASAPWPIHDPVTGEDVSHIWGEGAWGSVADVKFDNCCVGVHGVLGTILTNQFSNLMVFSSIPSSERMVTKEGDVARQAAVLLEPEFAGATLQISNACVSSFAPTNVCETATMVQPGNGRAFLIDCPAEGATGLETTHLPPPPSAHIEIHGLTLSNIPESHLVGVTPGTTSQVRIVGFIHDGIRRPDVFLPER